MTCLILTRSCSHFPPFGTTLREFVFFGITKQDAITPYILITSLVNYAMKRNQPDTMKTYLAFGWLLAHVRHVFIIPARKTYLWYLGDSIIDKVNFSLTGETPFFFLEKH